MKIKLFSFLAVTILAQSKNLLALPVIVFEDSQTNSYRYSLNLDPNLFGFYSELLKNGRPVGLYESLSPDLAALMEDESKDLSEESIDQYKNSLSRHSGQIANLTGGVIANSVTPTTIDRINESSTQEALSQNIHKHFQSKFWLTQQYVNGKKRVKSQVETREALWKSDFQTCLNEAVQFLSLSILTYQSLSHLADKPAALKAFSLPAEAWEQREMIGRFYGEFENIAGSGFAFPCIASSESLELRQILSGDFNFNKFNDNPEQLLVLRRMATLPTEDKIFYSIFVRLAFAEDSPREEFRRFLWLKAHTSNQLDSEWKISIQNWTDLYIQENNLEGPQAVEISERADQIISKMSEIKEGL